MYDVEHSIQLLYKLQSSYWGRGVFRTLSNIEDGASCKKNNARVQASGKKFFRAGKVSSENWGTYMNISSKTQEKKGSQGKILEVFVLDTYKTTFTIEAQK